MAQTPFTFTKPYDHPAKVNDKTGAARRVTAYAARAYDAVPNDVAERAAELGYGEVTPAGKAPPSDAKTTGTGKGAADGGKSAPGSTTSHGAVDG